jgi:DNA-binding NtrC family response regulator
MAPPHSHHHVLLVDDDLDILDALGALLELHHVVVERAASAFAALGKLQSGTHPCLVLLDIRMPGMSGWDLWRWMQRDATTAGIPVVLISGEKVNRPDALAQGILDVLVKPVEIDQVLGLVSRCCELPVG